MVALRLNDLTAKMGGKILNGSPELCFEKFTIDSRTASPGDLFFAIVAKRDGHQFIADAAQKGAAGAVVSREISLPHKNFGLILVPNTLEALQRLARQVLLESKVQVVGITGSVGKTTTKEFTSSLLSSRFSILKSEGNLNNHLGLALSLLRLEGHHQIAVLEMAMSGKGEIRTLTQIAPPDVAVITNINPVHLQFFSSIEEIALAKKEILEGAKEKGWAILNGDDELIKKISQYWRGKRLTFGLSPDCDIQAKNIKKLGFDGLIFDLKYDREEASLRFPFFYESYLHNLLASCAVAHVFSLSLEEIVPLIARLQPFPRRGCLFHLKKGIKLVDDSYNSNPKALERALESLASLPGMRKVAVLGDMLELGEKEKAFHWKAGEDVARCGWNVLITVGSLSLHIKEAALSSGMKPENIFSFSNSEEAAEKIVTLLQEGDLVLVKGSRAMEMEKIVEKLKGKLKE